MRSLSFDLNTIIAVQVTAGPFVAPASLDDDMKIVVCFQRYLFIPWLNSSLTLEVQDYQNDSPQFGMIKKFPTKTIVDLVKTYYFNG